MGTAPFEHAQPEPLGRWLHETAMDSARLPFGDSRCAEFAALVAIPETVAASPDATKYRTVAVLGGVVGKGADERFHGFQAALVEESRHRHGAWRLRLLLGESCVYQGVVNEAGGSHAIATRQPDASMRLVEMTAIDNDGLETFCSILERVRFSRRATKSVLHRLALSGFLGDQAASEAAKIQAKRNGWLRVFSEFGGAMVRGTGHVLPWPQRKGDAA